MRFGGGDIIKKEYYRRVQKVIRGFRRGKTREQILERMHWLIFAIEESQDVMGRYLKQDDDLATAMNCGRNYKISFCYFNNLRKISRLLGISRKKLKFIEQLKRGEFVFYNGEKIERVEFPLFQGYGSLMKKGLLRSGTFGLRS